MLATGCHVEREVAAIRVRLEAEGGKRRKDERDLAPTVGDRYALGLEGIVGRQSSLEMSPPGLTF